jgi:hypothetical protein
MHLAYYVTGHGYGHASRCCALCENLPVSVQVTLCTSIPRSFFDEELKREFNYRMVEFDCGCVQHDSVLVDVKATLETYTAIAHRNEIFLQGEVSWCLSQGINAIVSDITPFAFEVAHSAGIPSIAVSNFSWCDIYKPYLEDVPAFEPVFKKMQQQYQLADTVLALFPPAQLSDFISKENVGILGRIGVSRRTELCSIYGLSPQKYLAAIYIGTYGLNDVQWAKLEQFSQWEFLGLQPIKGAPCNYHAIEKVDCSYTDLLSSVDCVVSKLGYGIVSSSLLNGVPLIYPPRDDFAEYPFLEKALADRGCDYLIDNKNYRSLSWGAALEYCLGKKTTKMPNSALQIARRIAAIVNDDLHEYYSAKSCM